MKCTVLHIFNKDKNSLKKALLRNTLYNITFKKVTVNIKIGVASQVHRFLAFCYDTDFFPMSETVSFKTPPAIQTNYVLKNFKIKYALIYDVKCCQQSNSPNNHCFLQDIAHDTSKVHLFIAKYLAE